MKFTTIREAEGLSKKKIRKGTFNWLNSGAEDGYTYNKNIDELSKIKIIPRILVKNKNTKISQNFFNNKLRNPIVLCPMGHQTQFEKKGEISVAEGITSAGSLGFFSTQGRYGFDDIKRKSPGGKLVWQIFPFGNKSWIEKEIKTAEKFKSLAICFCFDAPVRSHRYLDRESRYDARKYGKRYYPLPPDPSMALNYDWDFIKWIKSKTKLPIIPKGLLNIEDIKKSINSNCDGIWISNHGGRMFNSSITPVYVLKKIRKLKINKMIIVDGGVRKGTDIIKLMYLGADFVGIGRPAIYGLICDGSRGVKRIFNILESELISGMKNGGFVSLKDFKMNRLIFDE